MVDGGEPRNAPAGGLHNFLTRDGTPPSELLAVGRAEVIGSAGAGLAAGAALNADLVAEDARRAVDARAGDQPGSGGAVKVPSLPGR